MVRILHSGRVGDQDISFILRDFEEFYSEIVRQKERVLEGHWTTPQEGLDQTPGALDISVAQGAQDILDKLYLLLERQAIQASRMGGEFATTYYKEAQFIMAALADEIFLNINWGGRRYWEDNLLESRFFGSHDAGDTFFVRLDDFLAQRDPARKDLAQVYLLALGLGFQGKFRNVNDKGRLKILREQLYVFVNHRMSSIFTQGERLFPEAYIYTLDESRVEAMQDRRVWLTLMLGVFMGLLILSQVLWTNANSNVNNILSKIQKEVRK